MPAFDIEAGRVNGDFTEVEREVLGETHFVGRVRQDGAVDHLRVAVALRLHERHAEAKLRMLVGADVVGEDLQPRRVETRSDPGLAAILDDALHSTADRGLALVVRLFPFLVDGAEGVPIRAFCSGPVLGVGRLAVREMNDPVLQQIAFRVGLHINGHVFVMRRLAALRLVVVVFSTVGPRERCGSSGT